MAFSTIVFIQFLSFCNIIRFWPPSDAELAALAGGGGGGGVEVNFGNTDFGSGNDYQSEVLDVKDASKASQSKASQEEDIISEDSDANETDAVIPKNDKPKTPKPVVKTPTPVVVKRAVFNPFEAKYAFTEAALCSERV
ncbi:hypothetical protein GCM10022390_010 [Flavobacterium anseonense]